MAQMFHDTMGTRVLNLSSSTHAEGLRSYAHCVGGDSSGGGDGTTTTSTTSSTQAATLLLINVSPTVRFRPTSRSEYTPPRLRVRVKLIGHL